MKLPEKKHPSNAIPFILYTKIEPPKNAGSHVSDHTFFKPKLQEILEGFGDIVLSAKHYTLEYR